VKRSFRLARSTDFKRVRRFGKSYAHPLMVLVALPLPGETIKVGIVASRSVGDAVERNRAKRLLREATRPLVSRIHPGWYLLLISRPPLLSQPLPIIIAALCQLLQKANLLNNQDG